MADSKENDLTKRIFSSLANLTGVRFWTQKDGEDDALGLEASELISSEVVVEDSLLDYQALTPKGFALSVATAARKGIISTASASDIEDEISDKALTSGQQSTLRSEWAKAYDSANALGKAKVWQEDGIGEDSTEPLSYKFTICFHTNKPDATAKLYYPVPFVVPSGKRIVQLVVNGIFNTASVYGNISNEYHSVYGSNKEIPMGTGFKLVIPLDGTPVYIQSNIAGMQSCTLDVLVILR